MSGGKTNQNTNIQRERTGSMGISLDFISNLPLELQEDILEVISKRVNKEYPLEIDDNVYFVEKPVADLVKQLTDNCIECEKKLAESNGIQKN